MKLRVRVRPSEEGRGGGRENDPPEDFLCMKKSEKQCPELQLEKETPYKIISWSNNENRPINKNQ